MSTFAERFEKNPNWTLGGKEPFMLRKKLPTRMVTVAEYDNNSPDLFERYGVYEVGTQPENCVELAGTRRTEEREID